MSDASFSTFLVDLDCLVDTRFSVLSSYGDDAFQKAFDEKYYTREIDDFVGIDFNDFKTRYENRDKTVLKNAAGTPAVFMLADFCKSTLDLIGTSPFHLIPKILINTYPYKINEEEKTILLNSFIHLTNEKAMVELVHLSKEEITPSFVKREISIMMMYDYYKWLEIHSANENFKKITCPSVTLLGPAIYFKGLPNVQEQQAIKEAKVSAFRAMEITAAPLINLKLLPIDLFSISLKLKRHKPT